jgi:hypothetical protein
MFYVPSSGLLSALSPPRVSEENKSVPLKRPRSLLTCAPGSYPGPILTIAGAVSSATFDRSCDGLLLWDQSSHALISVISSSTSASFITALLRHPFRFFRFSPEPPSPSPRMMGTKRQIRCSWQVGRAMSSSLVWPYVPFCRLFSECDSPIHVSPTAHDRVHVRRNSRIVLRNHPPYPGRRVSRERLSLQ